MNKSEQTACRCAQGISALGLFLRAVHITRPRKGHPTLVCNVGLIASANIVRATRVKLTTTERVVAYQLFLQYGVATKNCADLRSALSACVTGVKVM